MFQTHYMEMHGQLHGPTTSPPGKTLQYPLERRLGGSQNQSGGSSEVRNSDLAGK